MPAPVNPETLVEKKYVKGAVNTRDQCDWSGLIATRLLGDSQPERVAIQKTHVAMTIAPVT